MIDKLDKWLAPVRDKQVSEKKLALSVVTIALNASKDLPLTIESIAGQTFRDFEYIVVDGLSWDESQSSYKRYEDVIDRLLWVEDSGVYAAMNYAAQECRGEYVLFMNAGDAFYSAEALQNVFEALGDERPDVVHGDHVYVDKRLELHKTSCEFALTRRLLWEGKLSHRWHDRFPCHQATLTKRSLLQRLGGYASGLEICADHDFLLRAFDEGATMRYVDETIAHYFGGGMSAQRGERCGMEWIQVYRSRSRLPQLVDRFFNAHHLVNFDTQSSQSGGKVGGFFELEGPHPESGLDFRFCWCAGDGFSVVSPGGSGSVGLVLEGRNQIAEQRLMVSVGGRQVDEIELPVDNFKVTVSFPELLPARSIVEFFPTKGTMIGNEQRFVSVLMKDFYFQPLSKIDLDPLLRGQTYRFGEVTRELLEPVLRSGWSGVERSHVWSIGDSSHLLLAADSDPSEIRVKLRGNPFVDASKRMIDVSLNGQPLAKSLKLETGEQTYALKDLDCWSSNEVNILTFHPHETAQPPEDARDLGVCLLELTLI